MLHPLHVIQIETLGLHSIQFTIIIVIFTLVNGRPVTSVDNE